MTQEENSSVLRDYLQRLPNPQCWTFSEVRRPSQIRVILSFWPWSNSAYFENLTEKSLNSILCNILCSNPHLFNNRGQTQEAWKETDSILCSSFSSETFLASQPHGQDLPSLIVKQSLRAFHWMGIIARVCVWVCGFVHVCACVCVRMSVCVNVCVCVFEGGSVNISRSCALLKLKPALHMVLLLYDLLPFYQVLWSYQRDRGDLKKADLSLSNQTKEFVEIWKRFT